MLPHSIQLKRIVLYLVCSTIGLTITAQSASQVDKPGREYSLKMIVGKSTPLTFDRNYPMLQNDKGEILSNSSPLFALRFNYSRAFKLNSRFMWDVGFELGTDSYNLNLIVSSQLVDLGWNGTFYNYTTEYDLFYSALTLNIRYNLPISEQSRLSFKVGSRFMYFIPTAIKNRMGRVLNPTTRILLFTMKMDSNDDKNLIILPDLTAEYYYSFPESKISISAGFNVSFSQESFITGTYQIFGDREILEGSVSKRAMFLALNLGVSYHL